MNNGESVLTLPLATLDATCCSEIERYHKERQSDAVYCLEIFRRALELAQSDAWDRLLQGCIGGQLRGRLLTHPAWRYAQRYQNEQAYLTDAFGRFWIWRTNRVAAGLPVHLDSLGGLLKFLHKCLHSTLLEELRIWSPPGFWHKQAKPVGLDTDDPNTGRSPEAFQHWPARIAQQSEPESSSNPSEDAISRERLRAIWSCARGEREQRVFVLRWRLGYPPREIAARWSKAYPNEAPLSPAAVSQMLQNILARYYRLRREDLRDADQA